MQLHSLTVCAFGPFAAAQRVDFDALGASGLFLFHGPTGAGKTSILDAVCFALYGQLPGSRAGSRSLRSDHAAAGVRPEVVLEATVRGRRLRLRRSPAWARPKRRGTGTTAEPARVLLQEMERGEWATLSTRLDETGHLVAHLLGLSMSQFCQVVLLPQGQFAEFLRADADRRRALLESLFDTERFADVERWLVERRKESGEAVQRADDELHELLARVAQAAGSGATPEGVGAAGAATWVDGALAEARASAERLDTLSGPIERRRALAAAARTRGDRLRELRERHAVLHSRLATVTAESARRQQASDDLEAARRAAPVVPLVAEVVRLDEARALAEGRLQTQQQRLTELGHLVEVAPGGAAALRRQVDSTQTELGALTVLLDADAEARDLSRVVDRLAREVVALAQQRDRAARQRAVAAAELPALRAAVETGRRAGDRRAGAAETVRVLDGQVAAAGRRDELGAQLSLARDHLRETVDLAQRRKTAWLGLREARVDGMAAELAARLSDGVGCPVCGSAEHPDPARGGASRVTRDDEEAAELASDGADRARVAADADLARVTTALTEAAIVAGERPVAELSAAARQAHDELARLTVLATGLQRAQEELAEGEATADEQAREALRLDAEQRATGARASEAQARLGRLQSRLDTARGGDPTVADRRARLAGLVEQLHGLVESVATVDRLAGEASTARRRALEAAERQGLAGIEQVTAHALPEPALVELEAFRRRHDDELAGLSQVLADPDLVAAVSEPAPDLAALERRAIETERHHTDHVARLATARARLSQLTGLQARLDEVLAARAPLAAHHGVVDALSRVAEGKSADNRLHMSLSGYVLTARLEQVAAAATERLERMSSGRYQLVHTDEGGNGRGRGGLHLRVLDAWTGAERDPSSLSGGESFAASLALALGLADVVTSEAGGSLLDTLFVDEGFGMLDADALDEVMAVLDELREGGRVVGIVSHVADLRQRIPTQLQVVKGRGGSTIRA